ncbi:hypothetical protein L1887_16221 [Cichorium endivia]|nr:hypothetical protein L1887_16221 [Cichorium endivia]
MASQILSALDALETQRYHFKAIMIAGMGLFTDSYYLFCIPPIMRLVGRTCYPNFSLVMSLLMRESLFEVPTIIASTIISASLMGALIGQIVFGRLGDRVGRRQMYGSTLVLMVVGSIGWEFSLLTLVPSVLVSLVFFRILFWIGIGGDYPLSATIMSEFANRRTRGAFIAGMFSMQGFGMLFSSLVTMIVCSIFIVLVENEKPSFQQPEKPAQVSPESDLAWRLILMVGAIPVSITYYWRMKMPETARFTALVKNNPLQAAKDMEKVLNVSLSPILEDIETISSSTILVAYTGGFFSREFLRRHGRDLIAAATNRFLIDIVFYSLNLFQYHAINHHMISKRDMSNPYGVAMQVAILQAITGACAMIPAYFVTVCLIDYVGRVKIQATGFFFMAICLFTMAEINKGNWGSNTSIGFIILYGLTFFFSFGPNTTTFIIPSELFPAKFRATCHGISGAVGKVGAIIGTVGFMWASHDAQHGLGVSNALTAMSLVCVLGVFVTYFFTRETMRRSLEDNENVDELTGVLFVRFWPIKLLIKASQQPPQSN